MKKVMMMLAVGVALLGFVFASYAGDTKVNVQTKDTAAGKISDVKIDSSKAKTEVKEVVKGGEVKAAEVVKSAKGTQPVLKKVVKFDSISKDGMYITVVDRDEKIRYMTNNPKKPYVVKWKQMDPIEITATYDVNAGQYVVDQALITPANQPMKAISKDDVNKALTKDAPPQPVEKKKK